MEFIRINNRKNFLLREIPTINPASKKYIKWWGEQKKRSINGFWSIDEAGVDVDILPEQPDFPQSNSWRYMPPGCYFYVNFGTILVNKGGASSSAKVPSRPSLDDVEWEFGYNWTEARGFSGFEFDEEYSCNIRLIKDYTDLELEQTCIDKDGNRVDLLYYNYFNKKGQRKTYVTVRQYIRQLFDKPLGRPIYGNIPENLDLLGTRDGGKSYLTAGEVVVPEILFDGQRDYEKNKGDLPVAEVVVGSGMSDKSRDLLKKVVFIMENLPGKYNKGTKNEIPCPFYKTMTGSIGANKDYEHKYKKKIGGEMKDVGTGAIIKHRVFTSENPEAAAGGRPGTIIVEEQGLTPNLISIHGGNVAAQNDSGIKFGSSLYIGTAGSVEKIREAEIIFNNPEGFDMLTFDNIWEPEHKDKIGWFIPAPYMARRFKDENGNTKIKEAYAFFEKRRLKAAKSPSKRSYEIEKMNYPLVPSEMFVNAESNIFPVSQIKHHYARIMGNKKMLDQSYKVEFYVREDNGKVDFRNTHVRKPIREFPLISKKEEGLDLNGCPEIFSMPARADDGTVPSGIYLAGFDPIDDDDNSDIQRSLQSFFIGNRLTKEIVFEYTGRTELASEFYEQCRLAMLYYNARCNYENNKKGFYAHMMNRASLYLLMETPEILLQKDMQKSRGVGNKSLGTNATAEVVSWGLELAVQWLQERVENQSEGSQLTILQTIKSPALLKEFMSFKPGGNFDRISALIMLLIAFEDKRRFVTSIKKRINTAADDEFFSKHWVG